MKEKIKSDTGSKHKVLVVSSIWILRIIIGIVFIVSGLSKAIDVWGFVFKIEDYISVWHLPWWRSLSFTAALGMSGTEFVCGAMLLLGAFRRSIVWWLLIIMPFFLILSIYIYVADPVSDCGCFGDLFILTNLETLIKNIVLLLLIVILVKYNTLAPSLYSPYIQWIPLVACSAYAILVGLIGYNVQPLIDFRSFPIGSHLMISEDYDTSVKGVVFERDGVKREFMLDNLPDSTWTYVETLMKDSHTDNKNKTEFNVIEDGIDITDEVIVTEGDQILLIIPEPTRIDISYTPLLNEISESIIAQGGQFTGLIAGDSEDTEYWSDLFLADYPLYRVEPTLLKELSRGAMSLVKLSDGIICWKRTVSSLSFEDTSSGEPEGLILQLTVYGRRTLVILSLLLISVLVILGMPGWIANILKR